MMCKDYSIHTRGVEVWVKSRVEVFINGHRVKQQRRNMSSRALFVFGDIIVKLEDKQTYGLRQSSKELKLWVKICPRDKKYFAKLIGGNLDCKIPWVAQRVIRFRRGPRPRWAWWKVEELAKRYDILRECRERDGCFTGTFNWGITEKGKLVIYDWGY
jgi:hypothetical protein